MRSNDIRDKFQDGFEPGPLQVGPDGGIGMAPAARTIPPPPRLCEAGPCRNYHRFVTQLDAERAIGGAVEQGEQHGRVTGDAGPDPFHVVTHHYCYPTVGIETDLMDLPVLECNRWEPVGGPDKAFLGQKYQHELADWYAARAELDDVVAQAAGPLITHVVVVVGEHEHSLVVDGDKTLRDVRWCACSKDAWPEDIEFPTEDWQFFDDEGNPITNLDATLHDLGVADGERLTLKPGA